MIGVEDLEIIHVDQTTGGVGRFGGAVINRVVGMIDGCVLRRETHIKRADRPHRATGQALAMIGESQQVSDQL